jgi:hypothetical protein
VAGERIIRGDLGPVDQEGILLELVTDILEELDDQAIPGWATIRPRIEAEAARQSGPRLAEARNDFEAFEAARERAVQAYGRPDPLLYGIIAALAAYLICLLGFPWTGAGLTPEIAAVLALSLAARWATWRQRRTAAMRDVRTAGREWRETLRTKVVLPFVLERRNEQDERLFDARIGDEAPPGLIEGTEPKRLVMTEAMDQVTDTARHIHSGSLGICGPRGSGKSTILQFFGSGSGDNADIRLVLPAPVDYEPRDFIIHLFSQLCAAVPHDPADRSAIAAETRRHLEELKYLSTYSTRVSGTLLPKPILSLTGEKARERAEQPFTLPELVTSFRDYSARVAAWRQSVTGSSARVVIGIDEVDKIRGGDRAEVFLNDIKAIFGVPGCLYIVSLSEDALTGFAQRTPTIRTTFDSAFDELVSVGPMTYRNSEELLFKRITGVPRPFLALCHVLAGGMPRDLVRAARALIDVAQRVEEKTLANMTRALVRREFESLRGSSIRQLAENAAPGPILAELHDGQWPGEKPDEFTDAARRLAAAARDAESDAVRRGCQELVLALSFAVTVTEVFGSAEDHLIACLRTGEHGIVDDLAAVRHAMTVNLALAHLLLEQYRQRHGIGDAHVSR